MDRFQALELTTWIVILSMLAFVILLTSTTVFALDKNEIEEQLQSVETKLAAIDIQEQKDKINQSLRNYESKEKRLENIRNQVGTSWTAVAALEEAENNLIQAAQDIRDSRSEFIKKIRERSGYLKEIKSLKEMLVEAEKPQLIINDKMTKRLGIKLDDTCITMIRNNFPTPCPTYRDLIILDNSITSISGRFTTDDDGFFHRGEPIQKNSWRWYDHDNTPRIFIDPPSGMTERIKMITIMPNFDNYFISGDLTQDDKFEYVEKIVNKSLGNGTKAIKVLNKTQEFGIVIHHDRYVKRCNTAVIDAEDWPKILVDTINYLRNGCDPAFTEFESREVIIPNKTEIDITTSPYWQYTQWLKQAKEQCKSKC